MSTKDFLLKTTEVSFAKFLNTFNNFYTIDDSDIEELKTYVKTIVSCPSTIKMRCEIIEDNCLEDCPSCGHDDDKNCTKGYNLIIINNKNDDNTSENLYMFTITKEGIPQELFKYKKSLVELVKKECEIKRFPYTFDDNTLYLDEECNLKLKKKDGSIIDIAVKYSPNDYVYDMHCFANDDVRKRYLPLIKTNDNYHEYDSVLRLPWFDKFDKFDKKDMIAFILIRYAWGMNLAPAYLNLEKNMMMIGISNNYDYPEPIALKTKDNIVQMYCVGKERQEKELVYIFTKSNIEIFDDFEKYYKTTWNSVNFEYDFEIIEKLHAQKFVTKEDHEQIDKLKKTMYDENFSVMERLNQCLKCETLIPHDSELLYNIACYYANLNNCDKCIEYMEKAYYHGWFGWAYAYCDKDLKDMINNKTFLEILSKMMIYSPKGQGSKINLNCDQIDNLKNEIIEKIK